MPKFDCIAPNADGTFTAFFGYKNDNGVHLDVPYGTKNVLALDTPGFRPTRFLPSTISCSASTSRQRKRLRTSSLQPTARRPRSARRRTRRAAPRQPTNAEDSAARWFARVARTSNLRVASTVARASPTISSSPFQLAPPPIAPGTSALPTRHRGTANWECIPDANFALAWACNPELDALNACPAGGY